MNGEKILVEKKIKQPVHEFTNNIHFIIKHKKYFCSYFY